MDLGHALFKHSAVYLCVSFHLIKGSDNLTKNNRKEFGASMDFNQIESAISTATGRDFHIDNQQHVGGGDINTAMKITGSGLTYFLKLNRAQLIGMFEAEAAGLHDMAQAGAVRVPEPVCSGVTGSQAFIVIEYLDISGRSRGSMSTFGEQLAQMHRHTCKQFGWHRNNTIGATPQINDWMEDWVSFWAEHRLGYQLELAARQGIGSIAINKGERLREKLGDFFQDYQPEASLLHGDLWSGNYGFVSSGEAVIFDPATYYGDREADLAMTELFGGFGGQFYAAYNTSWPLDKGYAVRKTLYNAYHILNHFNMFGGGYGSQAASMIERCLAEVS